jgi:exportin-T
MAGQQDVGAGSFQGSVRDEAIATFTEIASKKMRPHEKIELINALRLVVVVDGLVNSPALSANRNTPRYDTDLAELVAKLINNMVKDIVGVLDSDAADQTKQEANSLLKTFVVYLLRFFADEYDEVCSTVVEGLSLVLAYFRKLKKSKPEAISEYSSLLPTILEAIIEKMRYDETAIWNADADDPDEGEFLDLRRRLANLQTQILAVDEVMVIDAVSTLVQQTFRRVADKSTVSWQDLDLALQEMYHFGDFTGKKTIGSSQQVTEQLRAMTMEMMSSGMFCLRRLLADFTRGWPLRAPGYPAAVHGERGALRKVPRDEHAVDPDGAGRVRAARAQRQLSRQDAVVVSAAALRAAATGAPRGGLADAGAGAG